MSTSLHLTPQRLARLRVPDSRSQRVAACVRAYMRDYPDAQFRPGGAEMTIGMMGRIAHLGGMLYVHRAAHDGEYDQAILDLLGWLVEQKSVLHSGAFLQGLMLKSVVLLCESLGDQLSAQLQAAVLERLATGLIDIVPNGLAAMLEMPGVGFHARDEQVNNWDGLGSMGLIYAAILSEKVDGTTTPDAARWLAIADRRFARFMRHQYTPEGEYGEGPGYYSYGGNAPMLVLDLLARHGAAPPLASFTLYSTEQLRGLYASANWSRQTHPGDIERGPFNFNDCTSGVLESPGLIHWIAAQTRDPADQDYADRLFEISLRRLEADVAASRTPGDQSLEYLSWSLLFRDPDLAPRSDENPATRHFGRFGTVISRTGYADRDLCLIFRCGQAAGAHSHCDAGTFMVEAFGERIVAEGGKPDDRSIPEYMAYHRHSVAHNVPLIDGQGQFREQQGNWFGGTITRFQSDADGFDVVADLSAVYSTGHRVVRRLKFSHRGWILVHDSADPGPGTAPGMLTTLLHTDHRDRAALITINTDHALIRRPRAAMRLFPLIASGIRDIGTHFHDSDREGLRSLEIQGQNAEAAYLLALTPAAPGSAPAPVSLVRSGPRNFILMLGGSPCPIAL